MIKISEFAQYKDDSLRSKRNSKASLASFLQLPTVSYRTPLNQLSNHEAFLQTRFCCSTYGTVVIG
jgi:hypothetical protein